MLKLADFGKTISLIHSTTDVSAVTEVVTFAPNGLQSYAEESEMWEVLSTLAKCLFSDCKSKHT